jgi:hypothetical protein
MNSDGEMKPILLMVGQRDVIRHHAKVHISEAYNAAPVHGFPVFPRTRSGHHPLSKNKFLDKLDGYVIQRISGSIL